MSEPVYNLLGLFWNGKLIKQPGNIQWREYKGSTEYKGAGDTFWYHLFIAFKQRTWYNDSSSPAKQTHLRLLRVNFVLTHRRSKWTIRKCVSDRRIAWVSTKVIQWQSQWKGAWLLNPVEWGSWWGTLYLTFITDKHLAILTQMTLLQMLKK